MGTAGRDEGAEQRAGGERRSAAAPGAGPAGPPAPQAGVPGSSGAAAPPAGVPIPRQRTAGPPARQDTKAPPAAAKSEPAATPAAKPVPAATPAAGEAVPLAGGPASDASSVEPPAQPGPPHDAAQPRPDPAEPRTPRARATGSEAVPVGRPASGAGGWLLVTGVVAAGAVLLCSTVLLAKIINPDLAAMPPVFRKPHESPSGSAVAVASTPATAAPASPTAASSPRPSPSRQPQRTRSAAPTTPAPPLSYEAEAARGQGVRTRNEPSASGGKLVHDLDGVFDYVEFLVAVPAAGTYTVTVYYTCGADACGADTAVNGGKRTEREFPSTGGWSTVGSVTLSLGLEAGENRIRFTDAHRVRSPYLDRITVAR